ncbi:Os03g0422200 [Oryza sativa Japonica Group]|uniref:Os03g0422200 protein n=2 Tax=Oryza sativa subsp. japonica TaxID=39947 RepID=Q0DR37_ORYSJ|eukprot:NP_001050387.1 Os03g0422200 [Oryza sativa Japonica Group]
MTPPRAPLWPSTATPHRRRATPPPLPRDAGRCPPNGEREREGEGAAERPREIGAPRVMRRSEAYTLLGTRIEESLTTLMRNGELCLAPRSSVSSGRSIRGWESLMWKGEGECHVTHCGHP